MFYVYVLKSLKDGKLYTGQTKDIQQRLARHNSGLSQNTKAHLPYKLVYSESLETRSDAMKREQYFKTGKGRAYLKNIINNVAD